MTRETDGEAQGGLDRDRLVVAGLALLEEQGINGLSMRALADRLGVKAASLYWHIRDRKELLDLLAGAMMAQVALPPDGAAWRPGVEAATASLDNTLAARRDAAELLLEARGALEASALRARIHALLIDGGLAGEEAWSATSMLLAAVLVGRLQAVTADPAAEPLLGDANVFVDSASLGVTLRAGTAGDVLAVAGPSDEGEASISVRGQGVAVRRSRSKGRAEVLLDPRYAWSVRVGGATSHTRLLLGGLHLRDVRIDSGASRIDVVLPRPEGIVRVDVSSGVTGVRIHRPKGTPASARVSSGSLRLRLDGASTFAALGDMEWSAGDRGAADQYELRINSGTVDVLLDQRAPAGPRAAGAADAAPAGARVERVDPQAAIRLLLDGVEARTR